MRPFIYVIKPKRVDHGDSSRVTKFFSCPKEALGLPGYLNSRFLMHEGSDKLTSDDNDYLHELSDFL